MELDFNAFEILSDDEERVLNEMNQTDVRYTDDVTIPDLFTRQAMTTPDRTAVSDGDSASTYSEIDTYSNRVARILYSVGVKPNQLVAIMMDSSALLVSSIFGILKSGAAYVPIDPEYPQKRIKYMLDDSASQVLVTDAVGLQTIGEYIPESIRVIICVDETDFRSERLLIYQKVDIERKESAPWTNVAEEDDIAYVIYTSGSTGDPKGVKITHKAVLNTLFWLQETFSLASNDVIAQKTSISFTDSVWEFFWPLIYGAKISIFRPDTVKDPQKLYQQLQQENITVTQFVPAQMNLFLEAVKKENEDDPLPHLKWVFNGGEALLANTARDWYSTFQRAKIANIYGMTESAIYATNHIIKKKELEYLSSIPLGKPIANTHVYILNDHNQLCPFEVKGEICIGGTGITTGYWQKPERTEKIFTRHPKTRDKLYRTGDLGVLRPNGIIEYLGRKDDQVQVRGFRVELKEVERAVSDHRLIKENAVISEVDSYGVTNLLCYFSAWEQGLEVDRLISFLKEKLPHYMIPSFFLELDEMPLTPNGKIDRKKLPRPQDRKKKSTAFVAPRNEKEQTLVGIWAEILHMPKEEIGIHDSFFEIGGNSISIIRLHRRIKQMMNDRVTVADLFSYPTISTYMDHFETKDKGNDELDQELMNLLDEIEDGSKDLNQSLQALNDLKEG